MGTQTLSNSASTGPAPSFKLGVEERRLVTSRADPESTLTKEASGNLTPAWENLESDPPPPKLRGNDLLAVSCLDKPDGSSNALLTSKGAEDSDLGWSGLWKSTASVLKAEAGVV